MQGPLVVLCLETCAAVEHTPALPARVHRPTASPQAAWLAGLAELRAVEQRLEVGSLRHASAEQRVAGVVNVLRSLLDQVSLGGV